MNKLEFVELKSYAKLNLALELTSKDANSYHQINTFICVLKDYFDVLKIKKANHFSVKTIGDFAFKGENILEKVTFLFCKEFDGNANFSIEISKNIKTGGGLGGGSSNAGYFLHFLLKQNNIALSKKAFCEFAFKIGADVPFFYNNSPKICTGYGEIVDDVNFAMPKVLFAILCIPDFSINTKEAFTLTKSEDLKPNAKFNSFDDVVSSQNSLLHSACLINSELKNILNQLKLLPNAIKVDMSGSGSTCFALFKNEDDMLNGFNILKQKIPYNIVKSQLSF
jgi:4-diphosphocytidyl-2-C-methyl-D-erythritol kinase